MTSKLGFDPHTRRHVPFQWLSDECRNAGTCGCGFCKPFTACDFGDCKSPATTRCPRLHYPVCARHYGANGAVVNGRVTYPQHSA